MKKPRRTDGICPRCTERPKSINRSGYCARCDNVRQREQRLGLRPKFEPMARDNNGVTKLQASILNYICHGLENAQIASRTGYSVHYVKHRKSQLYNITGCINSAHLAAWAVLFGYYKPLSKTETSVFTNGHQIDDGVVL